MEQPQDIIINCMDDSSGSSSFSSLEYLRMYDGVHTAGAAFVVSIAGGVAGYNVAENVASKNTTSTTEVEPHDFAQQAVGDSEGLSTGDFGFFAGALIVGGIASAVRHTYLKRITLPGTKGIYSGRKLPTNK